MGNRLGKPRNHDINLLDSCMLVESKQWENFFILFQVPSSAPSKNQ